MLGAPDGWGGVTLVRVLVPAVAQMQGPGTDDPVVEVLLKGHLKIKV